MKIVNGYEIKPEAKLQGADLRKANLNRATLNRANFWRANLRKANFWRANLENAYLYRTDLRDANLKEAKLKGANLYDTLLGNNNRDDLYTFSGLGNYKRIVNYLFSENTVWAGCFVGTAEEFLKAVTEKYGNDDPYTQAAKHALELKNQWEKTT